MIPVAAASHKYATPCIAPPLKRETSLPLEYDLLVEQSSEEQVYYYSSHCSVLLRRMFSLLVSAPCTSKRDAAPYSSVLNTRTDAYTSGSEKRHIRILLVQSTTVRNNTNPTDVNPQLYE
jgi:hypothetical protein